MSLADGANGSLTSQARLQRLVQGHADQASGSMSRTKTDLDAPVRSMTPCLLAQLFGQKRGRKSHWCGAATGCEQS
jgi:hypothetical protein